MGSDTKDRMGYVVAWGCCIRELEARPGFKVCERGMALFRFWSGGWEEVSGWVEVCWLTLTDWWERFRGSGSLPAL